LAGSAAEVAIRTAVVERLRRELPGARIIHELKVGGGTNIADLATVEKDRLLLFEIKSERDVLKRAKKQMECFSKHAHGAILVLHERWFDRTPYSDGSKRFVVPDEFRSYGWPTWCYPEDADDSAHGRFYRWVLPRPSLRQPAARALLGILWRQEMVNVAAAHRVSIGRRENMTSIGDQLAWHLTGREICHAVCRELRQRPFAAADAPIFAEAA
jgi:hypothetical protein